MLNEKTTTEAPARSAYSLPEVAEMMGVSVRTAQRWAAEQKIEVVKIGPRTFVPSAVLEGVTSFQSSARTAYTLGEVAERLGVQKRTVQRWAESKQIEFVEVGPLKLVPVSYLEKVRLGEVE